MLAVSALPDRVGFEDQANVLAGHDADVAETLRLARAYDAAAELYPMSLLKRDDADHRNCTRGDFDPCDCKRLPGLAEELEQRRVAWEQHLQVLRELAEDAVQGYWRVRNRYPLWDSYDCL